MNSKANPLKVDDAPMPKAGPGEVLVKNAAVAINPVDWKIQDYDFFVKKYPFILGTDVAGTVEETGPDVSHVKKGQRVLGHCVNLASGRLEDGAFQLYSICPAKLVAPIPQSMSFESATVLPLAISTAAMGLYGKEALGLPFPEVEPKKTSNKTVIVVGGASSVGTVAVQLCAASGLNIISTSSPKNHNYVKSLGASEVLDSSDPDLASSLASKVPKGQFAGIYDAIATPDTFKVTYAVIEKLGGGSLTYVLEAPEDLKKPDNLKAYHIFGAAIHLKTPEIVDAVWQSFLPPALETGTIKALPEPLVVGKGLEAIQKGLDRQKEGVSAQKVVISL